MPLNARTDDIFERERASWYADPVSAFDAWMAGQAFKASSANVYRAQWGLFVEWLDVKRVNLKTVDRPAIEQFVTQLDIRKPQRVRYLRLIERVLDHVRQIELASTNPASVYCTRWRSTLAGCTGERANRFSIAQRARGAGRLPFLADW